ncbi:hypothetical protein [Lacihabitans sp. LS3-19]|uniref:hypothetical protein n=1 Tax=Lacihabitans sp. LS3-19 TaxID=2487335 RepID=UPI0020CDAA1E|nr:hypothetical protein [Lacihabitans sp. LS3-19]
MDQDDFEVIIQSQSIGKAFISSSDGNNLSGFITGSKIVIGETNNAINKVTFGIPNLREFYGEPIKSNAVSYLGRLNLENENFIITIDKNPFFKKYHTNLKNIGGYQILYSGEIVSKNGIFKSKEIEEIRTICDIFFSFINGRKTSMLFLKGFNNENLVWEDFTPYNKVDAFKHVMSWPQFSSGLNFNEIWGNFVKIGSTDMGKDFLNSVIHWYTTSNMNLALVEGSIILSQTALELLYNYLIVETEGFIKGDDSKNITAANKLRMFLTFSKINCSIPNKFIKLSEFIRSDNNFKNNEIEGLINIRNCIVHSQLEKRKKLKKIDNGVLVETSQLFMYFIELGLLRVLGYKGKFLNRCSGNEEYVPWVTAEE